MGSMPARRLSSPDAQIVKEPMDLKTMRNKVQAGKYKNLQEMRNDCELMSKNALLFNRAPGEVRISATPAAVRGGCSHFLCCWRFAF